MRGKVWKFGDDVNTDDIIPAVHLVSTEEKELAKNCFINMKPEFSKQASAGDVIAAGENFGCGSSREHAPRAVKGLGISCVIAKSFARIFYRNSINIGLPLVECPGFAEDAEEGDEAEINLERGYIRNRTSGREYSFPPYPEFLSEIIKSGGLMKHAGREKKNENL
jgi:3-isopropylmalate/(R)-2-methylmalate dehydratase small subunit